MEIHQLEYFLAVEKYKKLFCRLIGNLDIAVHLVTADQETGRGIGREIVRAPSAFSSSDSRWRRVSRSCTNHRCGD